MSEPARVLLVDGGKPVDVFDVVEVGNDVARVRTALLFDLGEEMTVRIEQDGSAFVASARVRAHVSAGDDKLTELELSDRTAVDG